MLLIELHPINLISFSFSLSLRFSVSVDGRMQYYLSAAASCIILAYIGSVIDNLLLSYLAILTVALFPGLNRHGIVKIAIDKLLDQVKQIKEKTLKKAN